MVKWKSFLILKEIKKAIRKFLRVWAKNKWRFKFSEKSFKLTYENLNDKLLFYPFSIRFSRNFVIL